MQRLGQNVLPRGGQYSLFFPLGLSRGHTEVNFVFVFSLIMIRCLRIFQFKCSWWWSSFSGRVGCAIFIGFHWRSKLNLWLQCLCEKVLGVIGPVPRETLCWATWHYRPTVCRTITAKYYEELLSQKHRTTMLIYQRQCTIESLTSLCIIKCWTSCHKIRLANLGKHFYTSNCFDRQI